MLDAGKYREVLRSQFDFTPKQLRALESGRSIFADRLMPAGIRPLMRSITVAGRRIGQELRFGVRGRRGLFGYRRLKDEGLVP